MKDHVFVTKDINIEGPIDLVIAEIQAKAEGLRNPIIEIRFGGGGDDYPELFGWRPMTEAELERQKKVREGRKQNALDRKHRAERKERELLAQLKAKYEPAPVEGLHGHGPGYD